MPKKLIEQATSDHTLNLVLDTLKISKQALVFVNTKRSAEKTAEEIAKKLKTDNKSLGVLSEEMLNALSRPTRQCERLSFCVKKGIAFHHAGLVAKQRNLIEENFRNGIIKIICCTPTLCLSKDAMIWHDMSETEVSKFKSSNPLFVLSKNRLISMKAQKVNRIMNSSKLIQIFSVLGYSIKLTPNHKVLIKRDGKKEKIPSINVKKGDRIATIGRLNIAEIKIPYLKDFIIDNKVFLPNFKFGPKLSYFIGALIGDGYSGAETINGRIKYKGSPSIVGIDKEIFSQIKEICKRLILNCRESKSHNNVPRLVLGKNKWFREFLCRCGIEKREKKHISDKLMKMDLVNISSLLRGLFDTDGYVEKSGNIGFSSTSKKLIEQNRKLLLRFGILSRIRSREGGEMKIYEKTYKTLPYWELNIFHKKSIYEFYKKIGFSIKRKQNDLENIIRKLISNIHYVQCGVCNYKIYKDLFGGRTKIGKEWGKKKIGIIKLLGEKGELGSKELTKLLDFAPRKKETRINHHYELISKRRIGSRSTTEWFWNLNQIGKWIFENIINKRKDFSTFFINKKCPLCDNKLTFYIKKGWRDSDFDGDIFWDIVKEIKSVNKEPVVYDVVLFNPSKNDHMFVANGFIVHNSYGLDLPAFRSILKDLRRYTPRGLAYIPVLEYLQMAGRAGRPKFDSYGEAIAIASTQPEKKKIEEMYINGEPEDIFSKLAVEPVLRTYLLSLIAANFTNTKKQIVDFFSRTFWAYQFADMGQITEVIERMLLLLEEWEFIKPDKEKNDFRPADEIGNESYKATILGKRVAELYIDPYTAHYIAECLRRAAGKKMHSMSFLQMISHTLEIKPLLNARVKEQDKMQEELLKYSDCLLEEEPSMYEPEYEDFINSIKTALFFNEWINEKDEEYLLEEYNIRPGEIRAKLDIADWLLYSTEELVRILNFQELRKEIVKLRLRMKHGAKEELLPLLQLRNIGRIRARRLYFNEIKDIADVKKADLMKLVQVLGKNIALDVKKQVGQDFSKVKIREGKRKGQISLKDY